MTHNPFYMRVVDEHRELHRRIASIRDQLAVAVRDPADGPSALAASLASLKELMAQLKQHFAEEEQGGLLDEAVSQAPRLGPQATALEHEHEPLEREICALIERAEKCGSSRELWQQVAADFNEFVATLCRHEAAENRLAEEAFGEESRIGA